MGGHERLSVDTETPSLVYELNLVKLSDLTRIPEVELLQNLHSQDAVKMQGVVVNQDQEVPYKTVGKRCDDDRDSRSSYVSPVPFKAVNAGVKQVLLTAASSTMCLDGSDIPKCLLLLGDYTLMEHILAQLFVADMERVVILSRTLDTRLSNM